MNKVITDGVTLAPTPFAEGLTVWSSGDGTPGSDTYANASNAVFVPADQDFGGALEILKTATTTRVRYMGQTPVLPGCYLRVTARIKAICGALPEVRFAGFAGDAGQNNVGGVVQVGPTTALTDYGAVVDVSAIVGVGDRQGVDMVWGGDAVYGHFGLDLTGANGGIVRIDDLLIEDVTSVFLRNMLAQVDVRDYGAKGDGATDDSAAFIAADADASGREILVPAGVYHLAQDVTLDSPVRFEGTVTQPDNRVFQLRRNFDFQTYMEAFEDETLAFKKGFQALLQTVDHESFDLNGRIIKVFEPIDMQAAVPDKTTFATRRVIRNGQFEAQGTGWDTTEVTSIATYDPDAARTLSNVANAANVPVGALVEGAGVGREVYVRSVDVGTQRITLSAPLFDAAGTQNFTFKRFKYLLDFSGFNALSKSGIQGVEFQCNNKASGIMLADAGSTFNVMDCFISRPAYRGITSKGEGCQGMLVDNCQFLSSEDAVNATDRVSVALNANSNDVKLRHNRITRFRHFALLAGGNNLVLGNHFFQGDSVRDGVRLAGLIIAKTHTASIISHNYVDNCFIEWTNEHDPSPEFNSEFSFSALSITNNTFLSGDVAPWFSYIVVKPHGAGHFLNGMTVTGNRFRSINGKIDRAERVDDTFASLDKSRNKDVFFTDNSFHNIEYAAENPLKIEHTEGSPAAVWTIDTAQQLPFGGEVRGVDSHQVKGKLRNGNNVIKYSPGYADPAVGPNRDQFQMSWNEDLRGTIIATVRMDA
ncbi:MAG: right-handed parallel beta-helix repeat-containing protein [Rhodobacteraceae bacterium]|nr:right-handed parallel beta-helix repeat-containing protein [Paracoccaceae bacterium]